MLYKLNWVLEQIRLIGHETLVEFFEVILSSIIRDVSQQEPADLRVRRRKEPLDDAPVLELFGERVTRGASPTAQVLGNRWQTARAPDPCRRTDG